MPCGSVSRYLGGVTINPIRGGKMKKLLPAAFLFVILVACTTHQVETKSQVNVAPVEIKPIHITIDVNIKVDRALEDFFGDLDKAAGNVSSQQK